MLALNVTVKVLMFNVYATVVTPGLKLFEHIFIRVHPQHVLLERVGQKFSLAEVTLYLG
jgi:hypothetical protein